MQIKMSKRNTKFVIISVIFIAMVITPLVNSPVMAATTLKIIQLKEDTSIPLRTFIYVGETMDWDILLNGEPKGGDKEHNDVEWKSSNTKVASAEDFGKIIGKSKGSTDITVTYTPDGTSDIKPLKIKQPVNQVKLSQASLIMEPNSTKQLSATILPANSDDISDGVVWKSSNTSVVQVDQNGNVNSTGKGTAKITATFTNKDRFQSAPVNATVSASCSITVRTSVKSINVSPSKFTLNTAGIKKKLAATISPSNADNKGVTWSSSNTKAAKVDQSGNVTAVGYGNTSVTAKSKENGSIKASSLINVNYPRTGWLYSNSKKTKIKAYKKSAGKNYDKYLYGTKVTVLDKISNNRYKVRIGSKTIRYTKEVVFKQPNIPVKSIMIKQAPAIALKSKGKQQLSLVVKPKTAGYRIVNWSSSNSKTVTVSKDGVLTAKKSNKGKMIEVTAKVGNKKSSIKVFVNDFGYLRPVRKYQEPISGAKFGAARDGRAHAAIDFAIRHGNKKPVYGIIDGKVKRYSYYYKGTYALEVKNEDGTTFNYAEIKSSKRPKKKGAKETSKNRVEQGKRVGDMVKNTTPQQSKMLHLEYYKGLDNKKNVINGSLKNTSKKTYIHLSEKHKKKNFQRRKDLMDPTFIFNYPLW